MHCINKFKNVYWLIFIVSLSLSTTILHAAEADKQTLRALIVTGAQHPAHQWEQTTPSLQRALEGRHSRFKITVKTDLEFLAKKQLHEFDVVVMNYCNWKQPGLSDKAKKNFIDYLKTGGGLSIIHFANGAFHFSLPNEKKSDWPEWRTKICRRVWDHTKGKSGHDAYGKFRVQVTNLNHPITRGFPSFETTDELYFRQQGTEPIQVLATARSKVTNQDEPMAFVYSYGKGRVFQTVLGHDVPALRNPWTADLIRRGTLWAAKQTLQVYRPQSSIPETFLSGKFGKALNGNAGGLFVKGSSAYRTPPLTVECWAKLNNKREFNILVANELKSSSTHWELYSYARSGKYAAYLPGVTPSEIVSTKTIADDRWHHLAMIYEASRVRLYVDGKLVKDQKIKPKSGGESKPGNLALGQLVDRSIRCDGLIDDVRISKGVREIALPTTAAQKDKQTIDLWNFDEEIDAFIDPAWTPRVDVSARYPWMKETDKDWIDTRFQKMNTGPMQGATFTIEGKKKQRVYHGLSVRIGDKQQAAVLYDKNLARLATAWTGDYLTHSSRRFGLLNTPKPAGPLQWSDDSLTSKNQPLPTDQARYQGVYLHGKRSILSWSVNGRSVLEMPWIIEKGDVTIFTRTLEIAPGDKPIVMRLADSSQTIVKCGDNSVSLSKEKNTQVLRIPATEKPIRVKLYQWQRTEKPLPKLQAVVNADKVESITPLLKGGPTRWGEPLTTKGEVKSSDHGSFQVDTLTIPTKNPFNALFFASGLDVLDNGDIAMCTAHGDVWIVSGLDDKLNQITWRRFATGMYQPLGLKVVDNQIYVLERGQITRLHDYNKDGEADFYECFNNDWIVLGEEHGYATCLERDSKGNFYFFKTGSHSAATGGSLLRVSKDGKKLDVFCTGFRHPNGLGMGPNDMVTGAGQEGNWIPKTRIDAYQKGGFYGDMRAHHRTPPPTTYDPPLCWLPREVDNSGGGQFWIPKGVWGPLGGSIIHLSYGHCRMMTVLFEKVDGQIQGGVVRLPMKFLSGICRGRFHPKDKHLYLCGLDGWQTAAVKDGCLQRVRYTGENPGLPVELNVHKNGVRIRFSKPLDAESAHDLGRYFIERCNYKWSAEYGSKDWSVTNPERQGRDRLQVKKVRLLEDDQTLFLEMDDVVPAMQMIVQYSLKGKDGKPIVGDIHHTIHRLRPALPLK